MRNATIEDVKRVQAGEYVPDVMFYMLGKDKVHMKQSSFLLQERLDCGQIIMETDRGELRIIHKSNLFPIKKHAFTNTATKAKPKREHVKGKRKYEKVAYDPERAVEVARKNGGWITLVYDREKVKRYYAAGSDWWFDDNGYYTEAIENLAGVYTHMYVPVKEEKIYCSQDEFFKAVKNCLFSEEQGKKMLADALYSLGWRVTVASDEFLMVDPTGSSRITMAHYPDVSTLIIPKK